MGPRRVNPKSFRATTRYRSPVSRFPTRGQLISLATTPFRIHRTTIDSLRANFPAYAGRYTTDPVKKPSDLPMTHLDPIELPQAVHSVASSICP